MASIFTRKDSTKLMMKWRCKGCHNHETGGWHNDPAPKGLDRDQALRHAQGLETNGPSAPIVAPKPSKGCCPASGWTVGQLCATWLKEHGRHIRSGNSAASRVRLHIDPDALGAMELGALTAGAVEAWLLRRGGRSGPQLRTTLGSAISWATRGGTLCDRHGNAALRARKPKPGAVSFGWLREDEAARLLEHVPVRWRLAVALGLYAGLRKGEIVQLRRSDVDLDEWTLHIRRRTKNGRHRSLPVAKELRALLPAACDGLGPDDVLFASGSRRDGRHRKRSALHPCAKRLNEALRQAIDDAGLVHRLPMRFHDTRHTAAAMLINRGVPMKLVSVMLGHSSVAVTERVYAHLDPDGVMRKLRDAIG